MALRDWSVSRLVSIWAGWLLLLFLVFLGWLVAAPDGVQIRISPAEATGATRWVLAAVGGLVLVLPPAAITYAWFLARVRKWSDGPPVATAQDRERVAP